MSELDSALHVGKMSRGSYTRPAIAKRDHAKYVTGRTDRRTCVGYEETDVRRLKEK